MADERAWQPLPVEVGLWANNRGEHSHLPPTTGAGIPRCWQITNPQRFDPTTQGMPEAYIVLNWFPFWRSLTAGQKADYLDRWDASPEWRRSIAERYDWDPAELEQDARASEEWLAAYHAAAAPRRGDDSGDRTGYRCTRPMRLRITLRAWLPSNPFARAAIVGLALLAIIMPGAVIAWEILSGDELTPYPDGPPPSEQAASSKR